MAVLDLGELVSHADDARREGGWLAFGLLAPGFPSGVVRHVLYDEAQAGRVELADGRARIVRSRAVRTPR